MRRGGLIAITFALAGCGASAPAAAQPTPAEEAQVATYEAEQDACVVRAHTLEESRACRDAVKKKWGRK